MYPWLRPSLGVKHFQNYYLAPAAVGCPDIQAPPGGSVQRDGNEAIITCDSTRQTKYITCRGSTWVGDVGECSGGKDTIHNL